ncbi:SOS response-associated peptidase family protein [Arhodomonas sp. AD133]|uniref:SOS response-associated peptidase family protein n=1 Tax=Arhodomonas sp. AD133 TaxID=3415009 RepID=UPI003EBD76AE
MLHRITLISHRSNVAARHFGCGDNLPGQVPQYNLGPNWQITVFRDNRSAGNGGEPVQYEPAWWDWRGAPTIPAESVLAPGNREAFLHAGDRMAGRRALVVANGWYVWVEGQPYYVSRRDGDVLMLGALWRMTGPGLRSIVGILTEP